MTFAAGMRIGRYTLRYPLGQGGFGVVFVANDAQLGRDCAIKFLLPQHTSNRSLYERFLKEARIAAAIDHPAIVTVFDSGLVEGTGTDADGAAYIAMELLKGQSLAARLEGGRAMDQNDAIEIARQIASALAAAHAVGVIHRDLKPENVFLVPDRASVGGVRVKVLDFGIAKLADSDAGSGTASSLVFGTPRYMSPEQCRSSTKVDQRTDIYALGVMLFEMLCGRRPFDGEPGELISMHQVTQPPAVRSLRPEVDLPVDGFVARLLAKRPDDRPATMDDVIRKLDTIAPRSDSKPGIDKTLMAGSGGHVEPAKVDPLGSTAGSVDIKAASTSASVPPEASNSEMVSKGAGSSIVDTAPPRRTRWWLVAAPVVALGGAAGLVAWTQRSHDAPITNQPAVSAPGDARVTPSIADAVVRSPSPPGMVSMPRVGLAMGSTAQVVDATFDWCKHLVADPGECHRELYERELPRHRVVVSAFFLDRHERTNREVVDWLAHAQKLAVTGGSARLDGVPIVEVTTRDDARPIAVRNGALYVDDAHANLPATFITHDGAAAFCAAHGARLPTEAEWERAARGSEGRAFPWGEEVPTCAHAVFGRVANGACAASGSGPVAVDTDTRDRTPEGVMHLAGNVAEWVADRFTSYGACDPACVDPIARGNAGDMFVIRGGTATGLAEQLRGAGRARSAGTQPHADTGFRCAVDAPEGT